MLITEDTPILTSIASADLPLSGRHGSRKIGERMYRTSKHGSGRLTELGASKWVNPSAARLADPPVHP